VTGEQDRPRTTADWLEVRLAEERLWRRRTQLVMVCVMALFISLLVFALATRGDGQPRPVVIVTTTAPPGPSTPNTFVHVPTGVGR
jgi:hypothetical protein